MRTTSRLWDEGVLTDVCLTGVLTDLCLTRYFKTSGLLSLEHNPKEAPNSEPQGSKHVAHSAKKTVTDTVLYLGVNGTLFRIPGC